MSINSISMDGLSSVNSRTALTTKMPAANKTTSEKKNTSSLPDAVVENIQKMAREGAKKSVYMGDEYGAYINSYKTQHISPDRQGLICLLAPLLAGARYTNGLTNFFKIPGLPFTGTLQVGALNDASMSICDSSGTEILSYDCRNGWLPQQSKAEGEFYDETTSIYYDAYVAERDKMKAGPVQSSGVTAGSELDMKA